MSRGFACDRARRRRSPRTWRGSRSAMSRKEYPHKLDHVLRERRGRAAAARRCIRSSSAASTGTAASTAGGRLLTLRRLFPAHCRKRGAIAELAERSFTREKVGGELAYLDRPLSRGFERPYGWAWLLYLHLEATRHDGALGSRARAAGARLRRAASRLSADPDLPDPRRHAFQHGLRAGPGARMGRRVRSRARASRSASARAALVRRRPRLPGVGAGRRRVPVAGADRGAVHGAHAARRCSRLVRAVPAARRAARSRRRCSSRRSSATAATARSRISTASISAAPGAGASSRRCCRPTKRAIAEAAADEHLAAALPHVAGDYMGEHWLASFALLALLHWSAGSPASRRADSTGASSRAARRRRSPDKCRRYSAPR